MSSGGSAWRQGNERRTSCHGHWRAPQRRIPAGATVINTGTDSAIAFEVADGMVLCLFDDTGAETRIPMRDCDAGGWHPRRIVSA